MIINTRPAAYQSEMESLWSGFGHEVVTCPVLIPTPVAWSQAVSPDVEALIVTSRMAAPALAQTNIARTIPVYAVGTATAQALSRAGFTNVINGGGTADSMLPKLDAASFQNALYVSGRNVSCDFARLRPNRIRREVVYDMLAADHLPENVIDALKTRDDVVVPFYSPRTLRIFQALVSSHRLDQHLTRAMAIFIHSRLTSQSSAPWGEIRIADRPDTSGVTGALHLAA